MAALPAATATVQHQERGQPLEQLISTPATPSSASDTTEAPVAVQIGAVMTLLSIL